MPVKAMVLAAGLGTRLRPLTDTRPKALVPLSGQPMLAHVLQRLKTCGFDEVIVNVHHFADQILAYLDAQRNFGLTLRISDERGQLLDTGGGLKQAAWFFDDGQPFLVYNVDILTDLDLAEFYQHHLHSPALVTLAVKQRPGSRFLLFDQQGVLCGWQNTTTGETRMSRSIPASQLTPLAFSGIHVISPAIFALMPSDPVFSLTPFYLDLAATHIIKAFRHDASLWLDLGKKEALAEAEQLYRQRYSDRT